METQAEATFGVILKKESNTPGVYADFGFEVVDVTPPGWTEAAIDATHHQSPNGWGEIIMSGIRRLKPFTVEINWIAAETYVIKDLFEGGVANWQILFPDGTTSLTFAAGTTDFSPGAMPVEGKMSATVEFTPSGEPEWNPAS